MSDGSRRPLLLACACFVAFVIVLLAAYFVPFVESADGLAVAGLIQADQDWLRSLANVVVHFGDPGPFAVGVIVVVAAGLRSGRPRHALAALVLVGSANALAQLLKVLLVNDRTHALLDRGEILSNAFPSGHATAAMSLALAAVLVAPAVWRPLVAAAGAVFAMAVSESVLVLAWHFPSDVIAGFLVATGSALVVLAALRAADERWPEHTGREAARRALGGAARHPRTPLISGAVVALTVSAAVIAVDGGLGYMEDHTSAAFALAMVAASAAALPAAMLAIATRRS